MPGQLLREPGPPLNTVETRALLDQLYKLHDRPGIPTSTKVSNLDISATNNATHVYIKVDKPESLCPKFEGPYPIHSRPSRSTITVVLGKKKDGELRLATYHWSSAKIAHLREGFVEAQRPSLGRPLKNPQSTALNSSSEHKLNTNSSVHLQATDRGDITGSTDNRQQRVASRPIRSLPKNNDRPITSASVRSAQPADFQTAKSISPRPARST